MCIVAIIASKSLTQVFADEVEIIQSPGSTHIQKHKPKIFSYDGMLASFIKAGFNNAKVDTAIGQYPTESFGTIFGQFNTHYDFTEIISNESVNVLKIGLGVSAGGLFIDSTLRDGASFNGSGLSGGSGLNNNYFGGWNGYLGNLNDDGYPYKHNRNFVVQNAYVDLQTKYFNFKGGRYESSMDYHSGYTQGVNLDVHFGYGDKARNPDNEIKIWWFSSFGRAFAYSEWFLDFYAVKFANIDGKLVNLGIHAAGVDIKYGGLVDSNNYKKGSSLLVRPFLYFYAGLYEAPGLKLVYENQFGNGFGLKTTLQGFFLHIHPANQLNADKGAGKSRYNEYIDEYSGNLNFILQAFFHNHNARVGIYKNFGSGNAHFGTYGNPMGFDFWTASVYDIGASISDVINRNAITGYFSGGGSYNLKYGTLTWDILARLTRSPRSDEESVALYISHAFKNNIALGLKLEWFRDTTKAGYNPGATLPKTENLTVARTDDRSHAFITFDYKF
ncbi:hypothetical protein CQA53_05320 [Helicobacter didelphidarum]|uniref:Outer membrane family protein n=2 Tax=Helicobacter didelphidarum TaxID=2040648 RepID=A0A3D8IMV8_9HELI|nr:hypothetical protein CQA53_05320 [Helicobacter didelphidarum]